MGGKGLARIWAVAAVFDAGSKARLDGRAMSDSLGEFAAMTRGFDSI